MEYFGPTLSTLVLHISSKFRKSSPISSVNIANVPIKPVNSTRNLVVIVANDLPMELYINTLRQSASFALYKIGRIRNLLDEKTTESLVYAFIFCHLDMWSFIRSFGLSYFQATKFCCKTCHRYHLHWLPVKFPIM